MLGVKLFSGWGSNFPAHIDSRGAVSVALQEGELPHKGKLSRVTPLSGRVGDTGLSSGTTNMAVNGSSTEQIFFIQAEAEVDIRLLKMFIYIEDSAVTHATFGNIGALANGIDISLLEGGVETFMVEKAKKFADLIEQTMAEAPFGNGATSFELLSATGTADAQVLPMTLTNFVPTGIRLGAGTDTRFQVRVADDLTGLDNFFVRVIGCRVAE